MKSPVIILAGGGHANIQVLQTLCRAKSASFHPEVILVSDAAAASYSGMLPGYMMGDYAEPELQFDLTKLAAEAGATFIHHAIDHIVPNDNKIRLADKTTFLNYDLLSLNIGIRSHVAFADHLPDHVLQLKPISKLLAKWQQFVTDLAERPPQSIVVVGAGAAGIETTVALAHRIKSMRRTDSLTLIHDQSYLLDNARLSATVARELQNQGINLILGQRVSRIDETHIHFANHPLLLCDVAILATGAAAPTVLAKSGLAVDEFGYLKVNARLQSLSHANVFAAGDCVKFMPRSLPKAGVFAVREGRVLAHNIMCKAGGHPDKRLKRYKPQRVYLRLIHVTHEKILCQWGVLAFVSRFMKPLKCAIDRAFMRRFSTMV